MVIHGALALSFGKPAKSSVRTATVSGGHGIPGVSFGVSWFLTPVRFRCQTVLWTILPEGP